MGISRKEYLRKVGISALASIFAIKSATSVFASTTISDNLGSDINDRLKTEKSAREAAVTSESEARQTSDAALSNRIGSSVGANDTFVYVNGNGDITESTANVGSVNRPVYIANGKVIPCNIYIE